MALVIKVLQDFDAWLEGMRRFFGLGSNRQRAEPLKSSDDFEATLNRPQRRRFRKRQGGGKTIRRLDQRTAKEIRVLNHWNHTTSKGRGEGNTATKWGNARLGSKG
eukprot:6191536-Amphidinium_carterae.5